MPCLSCPTKQRKSFSGKWRPVDFSSEARCSGEREWISVTTDCDLGKTSWRAWGSESRVSAGETAVKAAMNAMHMTVIVASERSARILVILFGPGSECKRHPQDQAVG